MGRSFTPTYAGARWWDYEISDDDRIVMGHRRPQFDDDQLRDVRRAPRPKKVRRQPAKRRIR